MSSGITTVVTRKILADQIVNYEEWLKKVIDAASKYDGFAGADVIRGANREYVLVFKFESQDKLSKWEESTDKISLLEEANQMTESVTAQKLSGLEYWFNYTPAPGVKPPKKYKMVLATALGLYPLQILIAPLFLSFFSPLGFYLSLLCTLLIMLTLMTYLVMPNVTKLLKSWLYSD